ncbi:MAG: alpha/beta hydrolase, partial [Pseudomonadota bacterium]
RSIGYVTDFSVYQTDLQAVCEAFSWSDLPTPRLLLAHSMGGGIGLRALVNGLDVSGAIFSAPMWGIEFGALNGLAGFILSGGTALGMGQRFAPGSSETTYVLANGFEGNTLTSDPDEYARFRRNIESCPELSLGGPSFAWVKAALSEIAALHLAPAPECPTIVMLGTAEKVVNPVGVRRQAARFAKGTLLELTHARHEILMEQPHIRAQAWEAISAHIDGL